MSFHHDCIRQHRTSLETCYKLWLVREQLLLFRWKLYRSLKFYRYKRYIDASSYSFIYSFPRLVSLIYSSNDYSYHFYALYRLFKYLKILLPFIIIYYIDNVSNRFALQYLSLYTQKRGHIPSRFEKLVRYMAGPPISIRFSNTFSSLKHSF